MKTKEEKCAKDYCDFIGEVDENGLCEDCAEELNEAIYG